MIKRSAPLNDIFEAVKETGYQVVKDGELSNRTVNIISRELMLLAKYIQASNQPFQQALDALERK